MAEFLARKIYQQAALELSETPPLPMEDLFKDGVVRYRVGKIITDAVRKPEHEWNSPAAK
jgi:hypothetical protein